MRYYQLAGSDGRRLAVDDGDGIADLTAMKPTLETFGDLVGAATITDVGADEVADRLAADAPRLEETTLEEATVPVDAGEVWAAGVTYEISEAAREEESTMPEMYLDVYDNERPEIFFKATPSRTVGPSEAVGIRADSEWDVPEPELGIVLAGEEIVGYTIGNDMSSRSIEGENPLYLPQAKVYDRCCSLGPCVRSAESIADPHDLEMWMEIRRGEETLYEDATNTGEMARTVEELADYYTKHNTVPEQSVLLTGTSLVPENEFTLREGDIVEIGIESIGTLSNPVTQV
ncbi:fumarylacetoacetate hydrolase family protein [Saliphagus infecundisoli]|uniref:Fumarylacetoacetate hydrolase family protein n=1 Tax=Saliphagus infecundisoli TaxID=1849069 RepID=A0ABD5QL24_9EURY|nr:fumarylacetoacetate hydrolase family protein [Saliphagus infecundisoli]